MTDQTEIQYVLDAQKANEIVTEFFESLAKRGIENGVAMIPYVSAIVANGAENACIAEGWDLATAFKQITSLAIDMIPHIHPARTVDLNDYPQA